MMSFHLNISLNETLPGNSSFSFQTHRQRIPLWLINVHEGHKIPFIFCYALILALSVVGNTSIIAIVARNPSMQSTINYLIANMAATDLVASTLVILRYFVSINETYMEYKVSGTLGEVFCRLFPFIRDVSLFVSIYSMVAIAFDRFFAVVFPMRATPRVLHARVVFPTIWLFGIGFFSAHLFKFRLRSIQGITFCTSKWPVILGGKKGSDVFQAAKVVIFYVLPLVTVTVLYSIIATKMKRQTVPGQPSAIAENRRRKLSKSVMKIAITVVLSFCICWSPRYVFRTVRMFIWKGKIPKSLVSYYTLLQNILVLISQITCVIHPYMCFAFTSNFRKCIKKLFPFLFFRRRVLPEDQQFPLE